MTCIVGIIEDGIVHMGADSCVTWGDERWSRKDPKLFRIGEFLIGNTGKPRIGQILQTKFTPPTLADEDVYAYMCKRAQRRRSKPWAMALLLIAGIADAKPKMWKTCDKKLADGTTIQVSCEEPKQPSAPPNQCVATCQKVHEKQDACTKEERLCTRSLASSKRGCTDGCDATYTAAAALCDEDPSLAEACKRPHLVANASCWTVCENTQYETSECISSRKTCQDAYDAAQDAKACKC